MLADVTRTLVPPRRRPDEETLSAVLGGRVARDTEIGGEEDRPDRAGDPAAPRGRAHRAR